MSFWAINIFYVLYFIFTRGSDVFESLIPITSSAAHLAAPFEILTRNGVNGVIVENILFTLLEVSLVWTAWWAYKVGVSSNRLYELAEKPLFVGIAGDSGVGKSTLARSFEKIIGPRNSLRLDGDDVHKWERGHENWKVFTHLNPKSNYVHVDMEQAVRLLRGEAVERRAYDHATGQFTEALLKEAKQHIIFQGLMPFVLQRMRDLFHLKIYMEADEPLRVRWKIERDSGQRNYSEEEVRGEIERRRADAQKFIHPQKEVADVVVAYKVDVAGACTMEYVLKNSIFIDNFVSALNTVPTLRVNHEYVDLNFQRVVFAGTIDTDEVERIAHALMPNMVDILEHEPEFEQNYCGINQLFFLTLLHWLYTLEHDKAQRIF